ncbi:glycosyltransferase [Agromyces aerolatus]|uniref:glycosyltransferase n=1 Tax=Agromyces sp. LY-1074 TaxID=3074080 RepID=UPI00285B13DF|nr:MULTISPECIES: glycosyltransferase [unclassified Agromyces]MDR5700366.1 glycosyltransferase [Agromyces sp. LY-1074]MDR5706656.1 glycosyltransferase [Agromyces sp. LY-1358]
MNQSWHSAREVVLDETERRRLAELADADRVVAERAAERYGLVVEHPELTLQRRIRGGVMRRVRATGAPALAKKVLSRSRRELWRARGRTIPAETGSATLRVAPAPETATEGARLLAETTEPYLALLRPGTRLAPGATAAIERAAGEHPGAEVFVGDSRRANGVPTLAPDHSVFRLREIDELGPVVVLAVAALRDRGGFRAEADGAELLDVVLRADPDRVIRLRHDLGIGEPHDLPSGEGAERAAAVVAASLERDAVDADVTAVGGIREVAYRPSGTPMVSIIVPTRGGSDRVAGRERTFVVEAVRGIVERTTWPDYELVIVADDPTPQSVVDELETIAGDRLRLVRWSEPFNFSAKMNRGAAVARGEYLLMLNDDVELLTPDWLEQLVGAVQQPGVGLVGAALYFEDGSIQHLGHRYERGAPGHVGFGLTPGALVNPDQLAATREVSGVTAACALVPARVFAEVGGFSDEFAGNYNDVDLAQKIGDRGLHILVLGRVKLYHFESRTRDAKVLPHETDRLQARWGRRLQHDRFAR